MKWLFHITKWLTGALFVFSGLVKLNDPSGFAIKLNEYFDVFAEDVAQQQDSISLSVKYDDIQVYQQNFLLYPSDIEKTLVLKIVTDSSSGAHSQLKFGGLERDWQNENFKENPQLILVSFKMPDGVDTSFKWAQDTISTLKSIDLKTTLDVSTYVKSPGFLNAFFKSLKDYSLGFSIFFCALEVLLGLAMLLGYHIKITVIITALLIAFFTFLTGYSAYFNKVTDCGCFGDFLKLKPWDSFKKDVVLSVMVLIMFAGWKHNKSLFIKGIDHKIMAFLTVLTFGFGWYCYRYLPVWDFLPYKKGNDIKHIMEYIPPGERATDSIQIRFVMKKGQDSVFSSTADYMKYSELGYEFVRQDQKIIVEGYKSPIHDFAIYDLESGADLKEELLNETKFQLIYIMPFLSDSYLGGLGQLKELSQWCSKNNWKIMGLSSASLQPTQEFKKQHHIEFPVYAADQKMLMTMARYNPTLYILKKGKVIQKYSGRNLPSVKQLESINGPLP
jgi:uncharacterized membrane protein YphA (DoxX/SURF4 family)